MAPLLAVTLGITAFRQPLLAAPVYEFRRDAQAVSFARQALAARGLWMHLSNEGFEIRVLFHEAARPLIEAMRAPRPGLTQTEMGGALLHIALIVYGQEACIVPFKVISAVGQALDSSRFQSAYVNALWLMAEILEPELLRLASPWGSFKRYFDWLDSAPSLEEARERTMALARLLGRAAVAERIHFTQMFHGEGDEGEFWQLTPFLQDLIAQKWERGDLHLRSRQIGGSTGEEAFSVAIRIDEALQAYYANVLRVQPQIEPYETWIRRWTVEIDSFDGSVLPLLKTRLGHCLPPMSAQRKARLVSWVHPRYIELTDPNQLYRLTEKTYDITFSLNTLQYLDDIALKIRILDALLDSRSDGYPHLIVTNVEGCTRGIRLEANGHVRPEVRRTSWYGELRRNVEDGIAFESHRLAFGLIPDPSSRPQVLKRMAERVYTYGPLMEWILRRMDLAAAASGADHSSIATYPGRPESGISPSATGQIMRAAASAA